VFDYCTLHSGGTITMGTLAECEWCWSNAAFITIRKLVAISITSAVPNICLYRLFPLLSAANDRVSLQASYASYNGVILSGTEKVFKLVTVCKQMEDLVHFCKQYYS